MSIGQFQSVVDVEQPFEYLTLTPASSLDEETEMLQAMESIAVEDEYKQIMELEAEEAFEDWQYQKAVASRYAEPYKKSPIFTSEF